MLCPLQEVSTTSQSKGSHEFLFVSHLYAPSIHTNIQQTRSRSITTNMRKTIFFFVTAVAATASTNAPIPRDIVTVTAASDIAFWNSFLDAQQTPAPEPEPAPAPAPASPSVVTDPAQISFWNSLVDNQPTPTPSLVTDPAAITFWNSWLDAQPTPTPTAVPAPAPEPESTPGDVYFCTDANFGGNCQYLHDLTYQCHNLPAELNKQVTSLRPDKGQLCMFYEGTECGGRADWIRWPGTTNMRGRRFDNSVSSWQCSEDKCDGVQAPGGCTKNADGSLKVKSA
jgi:hypothetical protein